ncbi:unnamed protein product [Rotaria sordida]|uniref:Uncharacterized protein n=1 Tax=Rotaria sordida TaxID=392033 RepID=A0A820DWP8_9BILA|nr:unnamed protein product [Rotaria sordida]
MNLMEEQCQIEQITIESFRVLLSAISEYLKGLTRNLLEETQNEITHDLQIDFQRAFYYFIKSANEIISNKNGLPPHVLFTIHKHLYSVIKQFVELIGSGIIISYNQFSYV